MFRKPYSPPIFIASFNPMGRMPGDGRALARSYSGESPWFRARQEQLEADVRRTWETPEPQRRVHGGYTKKRTRVIPFKSRRKDGVGRGNRGPLGEMPRALKSGGRPHGPPHLKPRGNFGYFFSSAGFSAGGGAGVCAGGAGVCETPDMPSLKMRIP